MSVVVDAPWSRSPVKDTPPDPSLLLSLEQSAKYLRTSSRSLRQWAITERRVRYIRVGKKPMFLKEWLDDYLLGRVVEPLPSPDDDWK